MRYIDTTITETLRVDLKLLVGKGELMRRKKLYIIAAIFIMPASYSIHSYADECILHYLKYLICAEHCFYNPFSLTCSLMIVSIRSSVQSYANDSTLHYSTPLNNKPSEQDLCISSVDPAECIPPYAFYHVLQNKADGNERP